MLSHTDHPELVCSCTSYTPDERDDPLEHDPDVPDAPARPPSPKGHSRQKPSAALRSFELFSFLARISAPMSQAMV